MARKVCALVGLLATAAAAPHADFVRARTKVPRQAYCGSNFAEMGEVLSEHLRKNFARVRDCAEFSLPSLREVQERIFALADPALVSIYTESHDNRRERHASHAAMRGHWDQLVESTPAHAHPMLRDGLCHEVVMRFVHHTTEAVKKLLSEDVSFFLPTLPSHKHEHDGRPETAMAHQEYAAATGCQVCHTRLVPLPDPETPKACAAQLVAQCGKRGQLGKDKCSACTQEHAAELGSCQANEIAAWCDHPDACLGAEECPVWPTEFSSPFTLHATIPPISGAKCNFYYKYTASVQAQTVDYYEKCFPFVGIRNLFSNMPCKLFFNPQGIYLSQPGRVDCCLFKADVGAAPPEFLQSFTLAGQDKLAPDMYGNQVKCDEWHGPDGFKYWTVGKNDALYKNFGHDIVFQDGPTGVTWRWGNFNVTAQDDSLFALPIDKCSQKCSIFLEEHEMEALHQDLHVKRASLHRRAAPASVVV